MGINKDLGLPFGDGMEKVAICFDVDGTLIGNTTKKGWYQTPIALVRLFASQDWKNLDVIIWSGGGAKYAEQIWRDITMYEQNVFTNIKFHSKLEHTELRKKYAKIIAIDDVQDTRLGDVNLIVRNK